MKFKIKSFVLKFLFSNKIILFNLLISSILLSSCVTVAFMISSNLPSNKKNSIVQIYNDFLEEEQKDPYGYIYPKPLLENNLFLTYLDCEKSQEMRSLDPNLICFDLYPSNNFYTPAKVDYLTTKNVDISFLLIPKDNYGVSQKLLYDFEMIFYRSNMNPSTQSYNDIIINQDYADYLLHSRGLEEYEQLSNISINLPVYKNGNTYHSSNIFSIIGVISNKCELYSKYKSIFGDFFIPSYYLTLPLPFATFIDFESSKNPSSTISNFLNVFSYSSTTKNYTDSYYIYLFEYRISFFGDKNTNLNISNVLIDNKYTDLNNRVMDAFLGKTTTINLIIYIIILIAFLALNVFFFTKVITLIKTKAKLIYWYILIAILFSLFTFVGVCLGEFLCSIMFDSLCLSNSNPFSIYLILIIWALIILCSLILRKKVFKNEKNTDSIV